MQPSTYSCEVLHVRSSRKVWLRWREGTAEDNAIEVVSLHSAFQLDIMLPNTLLSHKYKYDDMGLPGGGNSERRT